MSYGPLFVAVTCETCDGSGKLRAGGYGGLRWIICPRCGGVGKVPR
jgi:DnaJ-class molecular chaperone